MTRAFCLLVAGCLTLACASERKSTDQNTDKTDETDPADEQRPLTGPPVFEDAKVRVSDGPLPFTLTLGESGMSGSRVGDGDYLSLSGPPGGPLVLRVFPATAGADVQKLIAGLHDDITPIADNVTMLGEPHLAVSWVTGESLARTAWCGVIVAPPGAEAGKPALLLEFGVGYQGDGGDCKTVREHFVLAPVLDSLKFD